MKRKAGFLVVFALLVCGCAAFRKTCSLYEGIQELGDQLNAELAAGRDTLSVAVVDFQYLSGTRSFVFGTFLAEKLIAGLFKSHKLKVIERRLLSRVLEEKKLVMSDMFDKETAKDVGRILGVEALVTGTLTVLPTEEDDTEQIIDVTARMISTETGEVFTVASVLFKDQRVDGFLAQEHESPKIPD